MPHKRLSSSRRFLSVVAGALLLCLAACTGSGSDEDPGTASSPPATSPSAATTPSPSLTPIQSPSSPGGATASVSGAPGQSVAAIAVSVAGGKVNPEPHRVNIEKGALVKLTVASDVADQIHVHGYDLEKDIPAGGSATLEFTADQTGLFEVETHESELQLVQVLVR